MKILQVSFIRGCRTWSSGERDGRTTRSGLSANSQGMVAVFERSDDVTEAGNREKYAQQREWTVDFKSTPKERLTMKQMKQKKRRKRGGN